MLWKPYLFTTFFLLLGKQQVNYSMPHNEISILMARSQGSNFHFQFRESQNHSMAGVGRDLCGSSSPTLLPKQGHLQQAVEDLVQAGLE